MQPEIPGIDPVRDITTRFRDVVRQDTVNLTFKDAAAINGIKEELAARVFDDYADLMLSNYTFDLPRVLGMDEKVVSGTPRFIIGDVENRRMLDMQPSRRLLDLKQYFDHWHFLDRAKVEVITQDMYWGYKELNEQYFKAAMIVVDKFHVVRYADFAVRAVRNRIQNSLVNEERVDMKRKMRLFQSRAENLSDEGAWTMKRMFKRHPLLEEAYTLKEWFYEIYKCQTRAEAEMAYEAWVDLVPTSLEPAFMPIYSYMKHKRWRPLIFNYFEHRYTNAYVEALNGLMDHITRSGRGYTLKRLRAKMLLRYGKLTPLTDEVAFDLMSVEPEEREQILLTMVGHGVDLSTFDADLRGAAGS